MKKTPLIKTHLLIAILFFIITSSVFSQSLLWEISGNGLKKPSYLYGTIHIQDKKVFAYSEIVEQKIMECDAYAMELLLDEIDKETVQKSMLMKDNSLDQLLTKDEYRLLDSIFKKKTGMGMALYGKMKPFFIYSQLTQMSMSKDMPLALDMHFLDIARKASKKALGIEKFDDQISVIDQMSLKDQCKMLMDAVKDTSTENQKFDELLQTYIKGDLPKMIELTNDTTLPDNFSETFLLKRNVTMARNIAKFIRKQTTFSAIGAAHLGSENGVIALLRKKGFIVTPVPFQFKEL